MRRQALTVAIALVALGAASLPALAQSTTCANLSADLAGLKKRGTPYDPYGDAVIKQRAAIDRATADYNRQCQATLFSRPSPACPSMAERISAMQANLAKLERVAPKSAGSDDDPNRSRILALMHRSGCDQPGAGVATFAPPPPGALTIGPSGRRSDTGGNPLLQIEGGRTFTLAGPNGPMLYREEPGGRMVLLGPAPRAEPRGGRATIFSTEPNDDQERERPASAADDGNGDGDTSGGSYRTLCVRTCDGYYFPVSYSASRNQFGNDAEVCHARCPGTETRLYTVKSPGEDGEQSFAADTGEPYTKLPNALRYRREVVNACTCGRADPGLLPLTALPEEDRTRDGTTKIGDVRAGLPVPDARPRHGEDPETLADIEMDFVPHPIIPPTAAAGADSLRGPTAPKTVRVVGPKFYADR